MILSRFWYVVLAVAFGGAVALLFMASTLYNRAGAQTMSDALQADASAVDWYLRDDARKRSAGLIPVALNPDLRGALAKAGADEKIPKDARDKAQSALAKLHKDMPDEIRPDHLFAVDPSGRVIASVGFEHADDWELGGYSVVADALKGWIRDDAWVWRGRILRVVARPVEQEAGSEPVGAVVGAKVVDDGFARLVSRGTGAAVGFYVDNARVASGAPDGFDKSYLDAITADLKSLDGDKDYSEKGRSLVRLLNEELGVVYRKLSGEANVLGAGYAVGRIAFRVKGPMDFLNKADQQVQAGVPLKILIPVVVLLLALGLVFSWLEHSRPLSVFKREAAELAAGKTDTLAPSKFRGAYKKIAADINDGVDKIVEKGGGTRKAANLEKVLGPIPAQPAMSAFALPGEGAAPASAPATPPGRATPAPRSAALPQPKTLPKPKGADDAEPATVADPGPPVTEPAALADAPAAPPPPKKPPAPPAPKAAEPEAPKDELMSTIASPGAATAGEADELEEWRKVYEEFVALKKQCGEPTAGLTFEKFKGTLQRNKDALVTKHKVSRVKFTVYVKDGKAALKAAPVK